MKPYSNELFEISDQTIILYQKYADHSKMLRQQDDPKTKKSTSSMSLTSNISSSSPNETKYKTLNKQFLLRSNAIASSVDYTGDPLKLVSEKSLSLYASHLKVGNGGAEEPSEASFKCYENFINKMNSIKNI